jgi:hypothetical protein
MDTCQPATKSDLRQAETAILDRLSQVEQTTLKAFSEVYREMNMQTYRIIGAIIAVASFCVLVVRWNGP